MSRPHLRRRAGGFSLIELLIAMALMLAVMASVFAAMHPAQAMFRTEAERADVEQRLRIAADVLSRDVILAGGGVYQGEPSGFLGRFLPSVLPFRHGRRSPDPPGTYKASTVTVLYVRAGAAQTTIAEPLTARSSLVRVDALPGCPRVDPACGFNAGATALVFDDTGSFDTFSVTAVEGDSVRLQHNLPDSTQTYAAGARLVEATSRTYYLKSDPSTDTVQLTQYDGAGGNDIPVADHVIGLSFEYFGDPDPPRMRRPRTDPAGPWTTYGPRPPAADVRTTTYPPGENCVFAADASSNPLPRLAVLDGGGSSLVRLDPVLFTDGPWCPDESSPNRYDADLLRIRRVGVRLRVESAVAAFRGPAGPLFTRGGTSTGGRAYVPDQEARLLIAPRNLNLAR